MRHRSAAEIQKAVIFALLLRELKTRFGKTRLGYSWAILEPLTHVIVLVLALGVAVGATMPGVDYVVYLITGIVPWLLFSNLVSRSLTTVQANIGLFGYRQVKPLDAVIARVLLETVIHVLVFLVLILMAYLFGYKVQVHSPLEFMAMAILFVVFTFGFAVIMCILGALYPESQKWVPAILRPMYFISGIMFPLQLVPPQFHHLFDWNPVLHAMELFRAFYFNGFVTWHGDVYYFGLWAILPLVLGLAWYRRVRFRLLSADQ